MFAAIDAGSNTLRLLIGRVEQGKVVPQTYLRRICRLAGDFTLEEGLAPESMERTLSVFTEFAEFCDHADVQHIKAVGTAAFRQAVNGDQFAQDVRRTTGLPLEIISGDVEAKLMVSGVLNILDLPREAALIIDIGGGSTEYILSVNNSVVWSKSVPLGVVRLTEGCRHAEKRYAEIQHVTSAVYEEVALASSQSGIDLSEIGLVGTAGTVTTLAALDMEMTEYDWRRVNNYSMSRSSLVQWYERLLSLTLAEREALPGMEKGRGDLIVAGLEIVICLIQSLNSTRITVSDFGLLEGILLSMQKSGNS